MDAPASFSPSAWHVSARLSFVTIGVAGLTRSPPPIGAAHLCLRSCAAVGPPGTGIMAGPRGLIPSLAGSLRCLLRDSLQALAVAAKSVIVRYGPDMGIRQTVTALTESGFKVSW